MYRNSGNWKTQPNLLGEQHTEQKELSTRTIVNGIVKENIHLVSQRSNGESVLKGHINGKPIYVKHTDQKTLQQHISPEHTEQIQEFLNPSTEHADRMPTPFVEPASLRQSLQPETLHDTLSMFVDENMPVSPVSNNSRIVEEPTVILEPMGVSERTPTPFHTILTVEAEPKPEHNTFLRGTTTEWFEPTIEYLDIPVKRKHRHTRRKRQYKRRQNTRSRKSISVRRKRSTSRKRV
jgi:hypothetical protein